MNAPVVLSPEQVTERLTVLTERKRLPPADLKRLRLLAEHLDGQWRLPLADALRLMFPDDVPDKAEANFRNLKSRLELRQQKAIDAGQLAVGQRLILDMPSKRDDPAQRLRFKGQIQPQATARIDDLLGAERQGPLYTNFAARPSGAEPILLLTVNEHERQALYDVFLGGAQPNVITLDEYPYDLLGEVAGEDGHSRPVLAFRCRMGSERIGASSSRVAEAIRRTRPCVVLAVGIAFGDKHKQQLGDVLIAEQAQGYESARVEPEGRHTPRGDRLPASHRWLQRCTQLSLPGITCHAGLMLCGEKLVDNVEFRERLTREFPGAIGGEMEATGVVVACEEAHPKVAWGIVKAVCDWGDGSINTDGAAAKKKRQRTAARNAAQVVYSAIYLQSPPIMGKSRPRKPRTKANPASTTMPEARTPDYEQVASLKLLENFGVVHSQYDVRSDLGHSAQIAADPQAATSIGARNIAEDLLDWLRTPDAPPVFALLGEYGMGKTVSCQRLYRALLAGRQAPEVPSWMRFPVYFDLRELSLFKNRKRGEPVPLPSADAFVDDLFTFGWAVGPGQARPTHADLQQWLAAGALLILDGLDECLVHLDEGQHPQFVRMLLRLVIDHLPDEGAAAAPGVAAPRLLVSCRTNFFKTLSDQRNAFTGERRGRVDARWYVSRVLLPLTEEQVREYLTAVVPELPIVQVEALIDGTHNLRELAERPMTLKLLAEYIPELEAERAAGGTVNGAYLYGRVARKWLERDVGKHHLRPEHKLRLMSALAAHLWCSGVRSLPYDELHAWFHCWRRAQPDLAELYAPQVYDQQKLEEDLRTATHLVRQDGDDDEQDGTEGFRFAHSSLAEYFLAVHLAKAVHDDRIEDWVMPIPSAETLDFLAQQLVLLQVALPPARRREGGLTATLDCWRRTYRAQASELLLRHALRALRLPERERVAPRLTGFDLSGAQLRGWWFGPRLPEPGTVQQDMTGIRWANADLRDCDFAHVRLDDGDFTAARLDLAAFQHCSAQRSDWRQSDLLGTVFRHCRLDGSCWQPLRQCHRPKVVACTGADDLPGAMHAPVTSPPAGRADRARESHTVLSRLPHRVRATIASRGGAVRSVAMSADGGRVVSCSSDGTVRVWDTASGESVRELRDHKGRVWSVAMSADGGHVVTGSFDGTVRVWDAASGESVRELQGQGGAVWSVAMSADGGRVVSGSFDGTVCVGDAASGESVRELRGHTGPVRSVAMSADGGRVVSGSDDGTVRVWDTASGESVRELRGHTVPVRNVAMSADGGRVVSCSSDGTVRVWDTASGESVRELRGHESKVWSVAMSADGRHVVSGSFDGTVCVGDAVSGDSVRELRGQGGAVWSVAMSADGGRAVSGSDDGTVRVWDTASGESVRELRGHTDRVRSVAMSADGGRVVSGSDDGTVCVWDAASGQSVRALRGNMNWVLSVVLNVGGGRVAMSADGGRVVSGSDDGTVCVWDAVSGESVRELPGHRDWVRSVAISADGDRVVWGSHDGKVRVWDVASGESVRELRGHTGVALSVAMSADGGRVVSGSDDGTVRVWDVASGERIRELHGYEDFVLSIAFSADGGRVVWGSSDGAVRVWDVASGESVRELRGQGGAVCGVAMSADGGRVVWGSDDGTVCVWDAASEGSVRELRGHEGKVWSVAMSADGGRVVSGSDDSTVRYFLGVGRGGAVMAADLQCAWVAAIGSPHGVPSHASWRPGQDGGSDTLISASGDAWRLLSWDLEDPSEPSGWRRVPLQAYE